MNPTATHLLQAIIPDRVSRTQAFFDITLL
jgi:hypothetical protein